MAEMTEKEYKLELRYLLDNIQHELAPGVHTYHMCECGRYSTRQGTCAMCLLKGFIDERQNAKL